MQVHARKGDHLMKCSKFLAGASLVVFVTASQAAHSQVTGPYRFGGTASTFNIPGHNETGWWGAVKRSASAVYMQLIGHDDGSHASPVGQVANAFDDKTFTKTPSGVVVEHQKVDG